MPTTYTHYRFGKDVLSNLPDPIRKTIELKRQYFDIGLHGPDILFYYYPFCYNHVNKTGSKMHKVSARAFFENARDVIAESEDKMAAKSYVYGFICHYVLDSVCHKYVQKIIDISGIGHSEIEMEWDRRYMVEDGLDPLTFVPTAHIYASKENAEIIAPFFNEISVKEVKRSLTIMRWALKNLLPLSAWKKIMVKGVLKIAGLENKIGLFMSEKANRNCDRYCDILSGLYDENIMKAVRLIEEYVSFSAGDMELSDEFNDTFSHGNNWENIQL